MITWNNIAEFNAPCQLCGGYSSTEPEHRREKKATKKRGRKKGFRFEESQMDKIRKYIYSQKRCDAKTLKNKYGDYARRVVEVLRKRGEIISIERGVYEVVR